MERISFNPLDKNAVLVTFYSRERLSRKERRDWLKRFSPLLSKFLSSDAYQTFWEIRKNKQYGYFDYTLFASTGVD